MKVELKNGSSENRFSLFEKSQIRKVDIVNLQNLKIQVLEVRKLKMKKSKVSKRTTLNSDSSEKTTLKIGSGNEYLVKRTIVDMKTLNKDNSEKEQSPKGQFIKVTL